jgi:uncharacterized cupin superfamily protein
MCLASIVMTEAIAPRIVDFAKQKPETATSKPPPERLLDGDPEQVAHNYFSDATGRFFAGVWESTPGRWRVQYTENEFCHLTRGRIKIEDGRGNHWSFAAGDSFVIPAGFSGTWHVLEPTAKLYVIYEPPAR